MTYADGFTLDRPELLTACPVCAEQPDRITQVVRARDPHAPARPWDNSILDFGVRHHAWRFEPCEHVDTSLMVTLHKTNPTSALWETRAEYDARMTTVIDEDEAGDES